MILPKNPPTRANPSVTITLDQLHSLFPLMLVNIGSIESDGVVKAVEVWNELCTAMHEEMKK